MEQTIVTRLYYPPGECQAERNEWRADTHPMQNNNLTQTVSPSHSHTHTPPYTNTQNSRVCNHLYLLKFNSRSWL